VARAQQAMPVVGFLRAIPDKLFALADEVIE
jgi:hypothetical protein